LPRGTRGQARCSIIGGVKWITLALAALALSGCAKSIDNQEAAQKAVDEYFTRKPELRSMSARVQSVIFRGSEADATVMVTGKGADPSTAIPIPYILERKSSGWEVKGPSKSAMAGHAAQNGGQMPPGHPGMGAAPGANGGASGQAMPPGHPAMGKAPGAQPDGSQKLNLPPDHPPIGGASK
jgi:hypothetical protein